MDTAVYKLYLAKPVLDTMLMPQERIAEYMQKHDQIMNELGVRTLLTGSIWSDEHYTMFGIERFPSWKALRDHTRCLNEMNWFQYIEGDVFLGVESETNPVKLEPLSLDLKVGDWIAHIFVFSLHQPGYDATEAELAEVMKFLDFQKSQDIHTVISVESRFANEKYMAWGLELYPSLETLLQKTRAQEKMKWWKYFNSQSYLGTVDQGDLVPK